MVSRVLEAPEEQSPSAKVRRHFHHNLAEISPENHKQQTLTTANAFTCYQAHENSCLSPQTISTSAQRAADFSILSHKRLQKLWLPAALPQTLRQPNSSELSKAALLLRQIKLHYKEKDLGTLLLSQLLHSECCRKSQSHGSPSSINLLVFTSPGWVTTAVWTYCKQ